VHFAGHLSLEGLNVFFLVLLYIMANHAFFFFIFRVCFDQVITTLSTPIMCKRLDKHVVLVYFYR
jgi:hypothetical protein